MPRLLLRSCRLRSSRLRHTAFAGVVLLAVQAIAAPASAQTAAELRPHAAAWEGVVRAELAGAGDAGALAVLLDAAASGPEALRVTAIRGLGRQERPELAAYLVPLLTDNSARVRAAAALAIEESLHSAAPPAGVRDALYVALQRERSARVIGALAEALGRLQSDSSAGRRFVAAMTPRLQEADSARVGVLRGLYFLSRQPGMRAAFDAPAAVALRAAATLQPAPAASAAERLDAERARVLALSILSAAGAVDSETVTRAARDASPLVRREAAVSSVLLRDTVAAHALLAAAVRDSAAAVRHDALRLFARRFPQRGGCAAAVTAAAEDRGMVGLAAIDLLGTACRGAAGAAEILREISSSLPVGRDHWQRPAQALVALAANDPEAARSRLGNFVAHQSFFVRTYAARAAAALQDDAVLRRLAMDDHANVRTAAVQGLQAMAGARADAVYVAQLERDDSELLIAASAALEGSTRADAAAALLDALDRITRTRRETSRDARLSLLQRARELGRAHGAALAPRLRPFLTDFDPVIAAAAAATIAEWTGAAVTATPSAPPALPPVTFADAAAVESTRVLIHLADGDSIEVRLLPFDAPANALRFARLARAGYFDGLTFHRVVPNFVLQGGSPDANEYSGDGPFTRDELGVPNWRGTVGLSTRGRHTGDAQFYINLIDNVRLDHDYTVFGVVTAGMDRVDAVQEGMRMERVRLVPRR